MPLLGSRGAASTTGFGALANLGYFLRNSLRFRNEIGGSPSSPAYLSRTFSSGNQQKWTFSVWLKKTVGRQTVFGRGSTQFGALQFNADDTLSLNWAVGGTTYAAQTNQVFRDPSAWYHIVWNCDSTQATGSNRQRLYVNGTEVTSWASYTDIPLNSNGNLNTANSHWIGRFWESSFEFPFSGYMTEINFVDGQQLTPSSFGKTDGATGQWVPKKFGGAYGTNGFYLPFTNTSSTSTLVADSSGNGNNWTPNNISLTAGATYDSMTDVPTLTNATTANYCTLNPLDIGSNAPTITNGSLSATTTTTGGGLVRATMAVSSGKWYWETTLNSQATYIQIGISSIVYNASAYTYLESIPGALYFISGFKGTGPTGTNTSYGSSVTNGDVVSVALDMDAGTLEFYKNGVSMGTAFTSISGTYVPTFGDSTNVIASSFDVNFGQRPFAYTLPTGYKALNSFNLP